MGDEIRPGRYRHFRGGLYEVIGVGRSSENPKDEFVVYKQLHVGEFPEGTIWIRPKAMFLETVEKDGKKVPRFSPVE